MIAIAALEVLKEEKLAENAEAMGKIFRAGLREIGSPLIELIRGRGLMNAIVIRSQKGMEAWDVCLALKDKGILAKPTHQHIIRFTPPCIITEEQIRDSLAAIKETFAELDTKIGAGKAASVRAQ